METKDAEKVKKHSPFSEDNHWFWLFVLMPIAPFLWLKHFIHTILFGLSRIPYVGIIFKYIWIGFLHPVSHWSWVACSYGLVIWFIYKHYA